MTHMKLDIDLPGFKKDEISATLENGYLTVSRMRRDLDKDEKDKERQIHPSGALRRSDEQKLLCR